MIQIHDRPLLVDRIQIVCSPDFFIVSNDEKSNEIKKKLIGLSKDDSNVRIKKFHSRRGNKFHYMIMFNNDHDVMKKYSYISNVRLDAIQPFTLSFQFNFIRYIREKIHDDPHFRQDYDEGIMLDDDNYLNYEVWPYWNNNLIYDSFHELKEVCEEIYNSIILELLGEIRYICHNVTVKQIETNIDYYVGTNMSILLMDRFPEYLVSDDGREFRKTLGEIALKHRSPLKEIDGLQTITKNETESISIDIGRGLTFKIYRKDKDHIRAELTFFRDYLNRKFTKKDIDHVVKPLLEFSKKYFKDLFLEDYLFHILSEKKNVLVYNQLLDVYTCFEIAKPEINDVINAILNRARIYDTSTKRFIRSNQGLKYQFVNRRDEKGKPFLQYDPDSAEKIRLKKAELRKENNTKADDRRMFMHDLTKSCDRFEPDYRHVLRNDLRGIITKKR